MFSQEVGIDPAIASTWILDFHPTVAACAGYRSCAVHAPRRGLECACDGIFHARAGADVEDITRNHQYDSIWIIDASHWR